MKRSLTGIAAAAVVLGAMSPMAFAATSKATGLTKASQLPIVVNGKVLSNPYEMTGKDSGNTTGFFPIYYFNQALAKIGFTATWDGTTHTWAITAPNVDASSISVAGGVGTGNTTVTVNGTVVKKFNTQVAKDPAGGKKAQATTYLPIYYINNILTALGVQGSFSGQTGLSITGSGSTSVNGEGKISAPTVSGQAVGDGSQASPAESFDSKPITVSATLTDANGNPLVGVNALLDIVNNASGAPTVKDVNGNSLSSTTVQTSDGQALQYKVPTDASGKASAQISVGDNVSASYIIRFEAPFDLAGTTSTLKSSKVYVGFVAPNTMGMSPFATSDDPFSATVSSGSSSSAGVVPVVVTIPPDSATPQQGVKVTFSLDDAGSAFFSTADGSSIGTQDQTVYTDSNGQAVVYVNSSSVAKDVEVTAHSDNYSDKSTYISWNEAGIVNKLDNQTVTGYQTGSDGSYIANLGDQVTFQATAEDENGNPVANAQMLIANTEVDANGNDENSAHGNYVSNGTETAFPSVSAANLVGSTNPSSLGEVVTTDSSGNFSFSVDDDQLKHDRYYIYSIQGGQVEKLLWTNDVTWQASTTLDSIGIGGAGGKLSYDTQTITGLTANAVLTGYNPENSAIVRFDGFAGDKAPIATNLNETYNITTSGEEDAAIWGVHVDVPNPDVATSDYYSDSASGTWYVTNPSSGDNASGTENRGVGSISLRVSQDSNLGSNVYDVYVNGTLIGYNVQGNPGWNDTTSTATINGKTYNADGQYAGTIELAAADDDNGNVKVTVTAQQKSAEADITFNGGQPFETEQVTPQITLTNGQQQDLSFTLEDINGNPVANTLGAIQFADSPDLWVTKINTVPLQMNESGGTLGNGSSPEPTPIPLWNTSNGEQSLTNGDLGYSSVNVSGVGSWTPGTNTVYAYSDANGKITLTLQDGAASYWSKADNGSVVSAPAALGSSITEYLWSPVDNETNIAATNPSAQLVVSPTNPGSGNAKWTNEGTVIFSGPASTGSSTNPSNPGQGQSNSITVANPSSVTSQPVEITATYDDQDGNMVASQTLPVSDWSTSGTTFTPSASGLTSGTTYQLILSYQMADGNMYTSSPVSFTQP